MNSTNGGLLVRGVVILVVEIDLAPDVFEVPTPVPAGDRTTWEVGPLPLRHEVGATSNETEGGYHSRTLSSNRGEVTVDAARRLTYFHPRVAEALYGTAEVSCRWHTFAHDSATASRFLGQRLLALEILRLPPMAGQGLGLVSLHLGLDAEAPATVQQLTGVTPGSRVRAEIDRLLDGFASVAAAARRAFTITFVTVGEDGLRPTLPSPTYDSWPAPKQALWTLASGTMHREFPPDPEDDSPFAGLVMLSADWRALVLRDGAAFVGLRPDSGDHDPFFGRAELYVRSIYLDAFLLGWIQQLTLNRAADRLAEVGDRFDRGDELIDFEHEFTAFRNTLWWQHVTRHGPANDLLRRFQDQHRLEGLLEQIVADLSDFARQVQEASELRTNSALGLITAVGLPAGLTFAAAPILLDHGATALELSLLTGGAVSVSLLATRWARQLLMPLRSRRALRRR